jgi:hypothetical protein
MSLRPMLLDTKRAGAKRWPRGQKFTPSAAGIAADDAYRSAVAEARGVGRTALDTALAAWAGPLGVKAGDGVVLGELRRKPQGLSELARALEECGIEAAEVRAAVDRLVDAGLVEPVPLASQLGA